MCNIYNTPELCCQKPLHDTPATCAEGIEAAFNLSQLCPDVYSYPINDQIIAKKVMLNCVLTKQEDTVTMIADFSRPIY